MRQKAFFDSLFFDSQLKANPDQRHLICNNNNAIGLIFENKIINNGKWKKRLGVNMVKN